MGGNGNGLPRGGTLVWAVVTLALGGIGGVVALAVFAPANNAAAAALLSILMPAVSVLIVLLQGRRTQQQVESVQQEQQAVKQETQAVKQEAEAAKQAAEGAAGRVVQANESLNRRLASLEDQIRRQRPGGGA